MATRNILKDGERGLTKISRVVTDFNKRLHILIDDMRETLIQANGLGLAAPQIGVLRRVALIVDTSIETELPEEPLPFMNTRLFQDYDIFGDIDEPEEQESFKKPKKEKPPEKPRPKKENETGEIDPICDVLIDETRDFKPVTPKPREDINLSISVVDTVIDGLRDEPDSESLTVDEGESE